MKKLFVLFLVYLVAKLAYDRFEHSRADLRMASIASALNNKLPVTSGYIRIEKVEYVNRILRFSGVLLESKLLTDQEKSHAQKLLTTLYCGDDALRNAKVSVQYALHGIGVRSYNDKVHEDNWSTTVRPESCS